MELKNGKKRLNEKIKMWNRKTHIRLSTSWKDKIFYDGKININEAEMEQSNLLENMV